MTSFGKIWRLGEALDDTAQQLGLDRKLKEQRVIDEWQSIVGEAVAKAARIKRFQHGKLLLHVSDAVWRQELSLAKEKMRQKINDAVGAEIVLGIILR